MLALGGCNGGTGNPFQEIVIDFDRNVGEIKMQYGANEDDNWEDFAESESIHELHKKIKTSYIRVWVSNPGYRKSTIPLKSNYYDFGELDRYVEAVLLSNAKPIILFAHAPEMLSENGQSSNSNPPKENDEFTAYVKEVVRHYKHSCENDLLVKDCNISDWYFEIWNEPYADIWWEGENPRYIELFERTYATIKGVSPESKVGGYSLGYFPNNKKRLHRFMQADTDFISLHHYGNSIYEYAGESEKMNFQPLLFYYNLLELKQLYPDTEVIITEYNSDYTPEAMKDLDEPYTAAWYASAIIWEIKSESADIELFYSATSNMPYGGFGMWSIRENKIVPWPIYYMKKRFVDINTPGSQIVYTENKRNDVGVLAVKNNKGRFITLVNRENRENSAKLVVRPGYRVAEDIKTNKQYKPKESILEIPLEELEVKFLRFY